jgi:hypothetical protein
MRIVRHPRPFSDRRRLSAPHQHVAQDLGQPDAEPRVESSDGALAVTHETTPVAALLLRGS